MPLRAAPSCLPWWVCVSKIKAIELLGHTDILFPILKKKLLLFESGLAVLMYYLRGSEVVSPGFLSGSEVASPGFLSGLLSEHCAPCIPQVSMGWYSGQGTKLGMSADKSSSFEGLLQKHM